jgi:hypothetical protein
MDNTTQHGLSASAVRMNNAPWLVAAREGRRTPSKAARSVYSPHSKQELVNALAAAAGVSAPTLKMGCTVPKALLVNVVDRMDLPINRKQPIVQIAQEIAYLGEVGWDSESDSTVVTKGASCITVRGLMKLRDAIINIHLTNATG